MNSREAIHVGSVLSGYEGVPQAPDVPPRNFRFDIESEREIYTKIRMQ